MQKLNQVVLISSLLLSSSQGMAASCTSVTNRVDAEKGCVIPSSLPATSTDHVTHVYSLQLDNSINSCTMASTTSPIWKYDFLRAYNRETEPMLDTLYSVVPASSGSTYTIAQPNLTFVCVPNIHKFVDNKFRSRLTTVMDNGSGHQNQDYDVDVNQLGSGSDSELCSIKKVQGTAQSFDQYAQSVYGQSLSALCANTLGSPLPITLVSFQGRVKGGQVDLVWTSANEINFDHFEIERSTTGSSFKSLGSVARNGVSNQASYSFIDSLPSVGTNFYRLKMIDLNGSYTYSSIVSETIAAIDLKSVKVYPNPMLASQAPQITIQAAGNLTLRIVDSEGRVVSARAISANESRSFTLVEASRLTVGTYVIVVIAGDGSVVSERVLVH